VPRTADAPGNGGVLIAQAAAQLVGVPYHFGGADLQGFDCSGLALYAHEHVGLEIPRTAEAQRRAARPVALDALLPGDLLFFRAGRHVSHVAIYTGAGRFIHAPHSGGVVSYGDLHNTYYRKHFISAGRFWSSAARVTYVTSPH
jgi:cell wall-associated NlpC family hydrolase